MRSSPFISKTRKKAVWGRNALIALFIASLAVFSVSADAGPAKDKASNKSTKKQHAKLDRELNRLADAIGDSDVIVEFNDDSDSSAHITANGGRSSASTSIAKPGRASRAPPPPSARRTCTRSMATLAPVSASR